MPTGHGSIEASCAKHVSFRRDGQRARSRPNDFAERLSYARIAGTLKTFSEKGVGCEVFVVGNVAVAVAGCEMTESATRTTRDVRVFLLVKNPDSWRIAAQAWHVVDDIPAAFEAAGLSIAADRSPQP